jgi:DHA1 family bicyclomycin/chloramphenicol resistance-like MFS transporter
MLFAALAAAGLVMLGVAYVLLPETLPAHCRSGDTAAETLRTMRAVITDRAFLVNALGCGIGFGAIFSYVAGAPFALENTFGLSPAMFSLTFGLNGGGLIVASHVNGRLVGRLGPMRLFTYGAIGLATGSIGLLVFIATHWLGLLGVLACMFLVVSSNGFIAPNAMALALNDFPHAAGSASALLGVLQFSVGAVAAPLVWRACQAARTRHPRPCTSRGLPAGRVPYRYLKYEIPFQIWASFRSSPGSVRWHCAGWPRSGPAWSVSWSRSA